ncbi:Ribonuclease H2 subunit B [Merluccius polli]|uniref:Ribonuclease H2 subunit B n=1 Tax=Merluccius polli TaxID=89951 RepID=A0AA47NTX6_MERPO|nr:Ribonuclease H2 subunit B [Merluccius polli]
MNADVSETRGLSHTRAGLHETQQSIIQPFFPFRGRGKIPFLHRRPHTALLMLGNETSTPPGVGVRGGGEGYQNQKKKIAFYGKRASIRHSSKMSVGKLYVFICVRVESALHTHKDGDPAFVKLRNPTTDAASLYLFSSGDVQLYEVKAFTEDCHSWFIGQTVQRDGRLLYITPMDPLYLMLPYLVKAASEGKFQPLDQVVMDEEFPACSRLLNCTRSLSSVHHIAEEKEVGSLKFHRYSQEKTMQWLSKKVDRTVTALRRTNISVGEGVKSTTYVRVKTESDANDEDYLRYAHGLVSEYINEDLRKALLQHLQYVNHISSYNLNVFIGPTLPELLSPKETEPPSKKRKLSEQPVEAGEDFSKFNSSDFARKPPKKMTAAQKTLAKVDKSGMKTMSSFFSPKVKTEKK